MSTIGYGAIDINSGEKGIVVAAHAIYNTTSGIFYPLVYQPSYDDIPQNSNNFINVYDRYFLRIDAAFVKYNDVGCAVLIPGRGFYPVKAYREYEEVKEGTEVCMVGATSGIGCSSIIDKRGSYVVGYTILYNVFLVFIPISSGGDSGCPWFLKDYYTDLNEIVLIGHLFGTVYKNGEPYYDIVVSITSDRVYLGVRPLTYLPTYSCG